jgi:hypothetical protein
MVKECEHPTNGDKHLVHSVTEMDDVLGKVVKKTLHTSGVAKTPQDVLKNLTAKE